MNRVTNENPRHGSKGAAFGLIMIIVGLVIIANQFIEIPFRLREILFSWQAILILIGVVLVTSRDRFSGYILMGVGGFFLLPELFDIPFEFRRIFWPMLFIIGGILIIFKGTGLITRHRSGRGGSEEDYVDDVNIFGGGDYIISSKNFKGGSIISVFGGGKYDFRQSDLGPDKCYLEVVNVFGGASLIVPSDWNVKTEVVGIFGGFSDKRHILDPNPKKTLIVKGIAVFGGGDIKNLS
ncbi:MAG: cell wall-active antibiotics response protein [Bacteroidales bacterium]|nr:cell wall-active antibiotics response protein [Bacteroidales bacterium]MCF8391656.1 cell wall-active antibiotics response protein [Bacteroidales bacterium]